MSGDFIQYYEVAINAGFGKGGDVLLEFEKENNLGQLVYRGMYLGEKDFEFRITPSSNSLTDVLFHATRRIHQEFNPGEDFRPSREIKRREREVGRSY